MTRTKIEDRMTAGPWKLVQTQQGPNHVDYHVRSPSGYCTAYWHKVVPASGSPEDDANAQAISLVPEMLAALRRMSEEHTRDCLGITGPPGEDWVNDSRCDCPAKAARAILDRLDEVVE